jgi:hypothetical protein
MMQVEPGFDLCSHCGLYPAQVEAQLLSLFVISCLGLYLISRRRSGVAAAGSVLMGIALVFSVLFAMSALQRGVVRSSSPQAFYDPWMVGSFCIAILAVEIASIIVVTRKRRVRDSQAAASRER